MKHLSALPMYAIENLFILKIYYLLISDESTKNIDDTESLSVLYNFNTLTMSLLGRQAVVHVMCMQDNLSVLMPFISFEGKIVLCIYTKTI